MGTSGTCAKFDFVDEEQNDSEKIVNDIQEEPQIQLLERQLQKAIDKEEYEMAARIRDKINEIDI